MSLTVHPTTSKTSSRTPRWSLVTPDDVLTDVRRAFCSRCTSSLAEAFDLDRQLSIGLDDQPDTIPAPEVFHHHGD